MLKFKYLSDFFKILVFCTVLLLIGAAKPDEALPVNPARPQNIPEEAIFSKYGTWIVVTSNLQRVWYTNGQLSSEIPLKDGKYHGSFSLYDKDGTKLSDYYYTYGTLERIHNYVIRMPNNQRPLNIQKLAYWSFKSGHWVYYDKSKQMLYLYYINGEKYVKGKAKKIVDEYLFTDIGKMWYQDGTIKERSEYDVNGKYNGKFRRYNKQGKLILEGLYVHGHEVWGHDLRKKPPHDIPEDAVWDMDYDSWAVFRENEVYIYDKNHYDHEIELKGEYYHGKYLRFNPQGKVVVRGQYHDGLEIGEWKFYGKDGNVEIIFYYENGELIKKEKVKDKSNNSAE